MGAAKMNSGKKRDPWGCWVELTDPPTAGAARSDETLHLRKIAGSDNRCSL